MSVNTTFDFNAYHRAWAERLLRDPTVKRTIAVLGRPFHPPIPIIVCADGFTVSAQASEGNYSTPRVTAAWPYTEVELGYPSEEQPILTPFAEEPGDPTDTVYGYVPVALLEAVVESHGGCVNWPEPDDDEALYLSTPQ